MNAIGTTVMLTFIMTLLGTVLVDCAAGSTRPESVAQSNVSGRPPAREFVEHGCSPTACTCSCNCDDHRGLRRVHVPGIEGIALGEPSVDDNGNITEGWIPNDIVIAAFEVRMQAFMHGRPGFYALNRYRRRYIGRAREYGQHVMSVDFVCTEYGGVWDQEIFDNSPLLVMPFCIFTAQYDVRGDIVMFVTSA